MSSINQKPIFSHSRKPNDKITYFFIYVLVFSLLGVGYAFYIDVFSFDFFGKPLVWASREKKPRRKYIIENME